MAKTITLTTIKVKQIRIDMDGEKMEVWYRALDSDGGVIEPNSMVTFWRTLPPQNVDPDGEVIPYDDDWYEMPTAGLQELNSMIGRLETMMENRILA